MTIDATLDLGPVYTRGTSFRARAEERQRRYRADILRVSWSKHGHILDPISAASGKNFVVPLAFEAAKVRARQGKGVDEERTFGNML